MWVVLREESKAKKKKDKDDKKAAKKDKKKKGGDDDADEDAEEGGDDDAEEGGDDEEEAAAEDGGDEEAAADGEEDLELADRTKGGGGADDEAEAEPEPEPEPEEEGGGEEAAGDDAAGEGGDEPEPKAEEEAAAGSGDPMADFILDFQERLGRALGIDSSRVVVSSVKAGPKHVAKGRNAFGVDGGDGFNWPNLEEAREHKHEVYPRSFDGKNNKLKLFGEKPNIDYADTETMGLIGVRAAPVTPPRYPATPRLMPLTGFVTSGRGTTRVLRIPGDLCQTMVLLGVSLHAVHHAQLYRHRAGRPAGSWHPSQAGENNIRQPLPAAAKCDLPRT